MTRKPRVVNLADCPQFITKDKSKIREIMAPANSLIRSQSLAEAVLAVGAATEEHYHATSEEIYYIISGDGEMRVKGKSFRSGQGKIQVEGEALTSGDAEIPIEGESFFVRAGDAIALLPGERHQIWNRGDTELVFFCICVPPYQHDDTIMTAD